MSGLLRILYVFLLRAFFFFWMMVMCGTKVNIKCALLISRTNYFVNLCIQIKKKGGLSIKE